jgi:pimeloyl-ACP methyl ester carboxylesterase
MAKLQEDSLDFAKKCKSENNALALYSTANAARDMDILRELLNDQKLNFLGKSYGTYLGSLYAKLFPDKVGKFILDGAVDPTLNSVQQTLQQAVGFDSAFSAFASDCLLQNSCPLSSDAANEIQSKLLEIRNNPITVGDRDNRV